MLDKDYRLKERILGVDVAHMLFRHAILFVYNTSAKKISNSSTSIKSQN